MVDIYIKYYNKPSGGIDSGEKLLQSIPAASESAIYISNPTVKCEMGNAESMDFNVQNGTDYYDAFIQMRTFIRVVYDNETIFYGRVLTVNNSFYGDRKVHCEGAMAFLNDTYYPSKEEAARTKISINSYMKSVINNHNSQVSDDNKKIYLGEVPGNYSGSVTGAQKIANSSRKFGSSSWATSKAVLEDLKSHYGGLFRVRYSSGKCYLDWMEHYFRSSVNSQTIEIGKNLLDISSTTELSNIFTVLIPIGKKSSGDSKIYLKGYKNGLHGNNSFLSVPNICKSLHSDGPYTDAQLNSGYHTADDYKNAITRYGRIFKTVDFQDAHSQAALFTAAAKWIKDNYQGGIITFSVKAIDLRFIGENTGRIICGDRVKLRYPIGTKTTGSTIEERIRTCTSVQYDLFNPENNQYTFGIPANSLSKTYGDNSEKKKKKTSSYTPPASTTDPEEPEDWGGKVINWLKSHKIWKKSVNSTSSEGVGPRETLADGSVTFGYFIDAVVTKTDDDQFCSRVKEPIVAGVKNTNKGPVYVWKTTGGKPKFRNIIMESKKITATWCKSHNIFAYVKDEYGLDLETGLGVKRPAVLEDENGNVDINTGNVQVNIGTLIDPVTGEPSFEGIQKLLTDRRKNQRIKVQTDKYGNTGYYRYGPNGEKILISIDPETGGYKYYDDKGHVLSITDVLRRAGVINGDLSPNALVQEEAYFVHMGALEADIRYLSSHYLRTDRLESAISNLNWVTIKNVLEVSSINNGYIKCNTYQINGEDYKGFTLHFGENIEQKVIGTFRQPMARNYINLALYAEEITGGKIRISFHEGWTSVSPDVGTDNTGAAVFKIAATKAYQDGVAASWNNARSAMVIPTASINVNQSDNVLNTLQILQPKEYSEWSDSSGDARYVFYNYQMEFGTFQRMSGSSMTCINLKSLSSNNTVAIFNIDTEWKAQYTSGYSAGFTAARNAMVVPISNIDTSTSDPDRLNSMTVVKPKAYGESGTVSYEYTMVLESITFPAGTKKCVSLQYNKNRVSIINIDTEWKAQYTSGYSTGFTDAREAMVVPTSNINVGTSDPDGLNSMTVVKPNAYGTSGTTEYGYSMTLESIVFQAGTKECVSLKYNGNRVAILNITTAWNNRFTAGQDSVTISGPTWSTTPSSSVTANNNTATFKTSTDKSASVKILVASAGWTSGTASIYAYHTSNATGNRIAKVSVSLPSKSCGTVDYVSSIPSGSSHVDSGKSIAKYAVNNARYVKIPITQAGTTINYYFETT